MVFDTGPEFRGVFLPVGSPRHHSRWSIFRRFRVGPALAALLLFSAIAAAASTELARWEGGPKPPLELDSLEHGRISLEDARGGTVLVHFFATWCEPCVPEMAALQQLATRRSGENLTILAVDVGELDARVRNFLKKQPVSFPVLLDRDRAATRAWQIKALPSSFIFDSDLVPVLFAERDIDWDDPAVNGTLDEVIDGRPGLDRQKLEKGEGRQNDEPT